MIACWFFMGSCFVLWGPVFSFCCFGCVLFLKIKLFGMDLSRDFLVSYYFFFKLVNSLQKNKLSSSEAGLIRFGYRGFSFLSHTISLWFIEFSKLCWLVWVII